MFKKKVEKDPYEGLHGKELVDAIMKGEGVKIATSKQYREVVMIDAEKTKKYRQHKNFFYMVGYYVKPVFFTPLAIMFHVIASVFYIIGSIASIAMIYGIYCAYKAFTAWKMGMVYAEKIEMAVNLIVFPFVAFAVAKIAEAMRNYLENNKY